MTDHLDLRVTQTPQHINAYHGNDIRYTYTPNPGVHLSNPHVIAPPHHQYTHDQFINQAPSHVASVPQATPHHQYTHDQYIDQAPSHVASVPQATLYPPMHDLDDYHFSVGNAYYHAPHPEFQDHPVPLPPSHLRDWTHGMFDVRETSDSFEGGSADSQPAAGNHHDFNRLRFHRTSSRHTPYTVPRPNNPQNFEHEVSYRSVAQSALPPVPAYVQSQPVAL
ncbi:hypothetical protein P692DRAFT_20880225, partial [Suillus brevipes Sb2]